MIGRIEALDLTLFDGIPSLSSPEDRRALLAVQRTTARKHSQYTYLEIGSYLGGSLQTHVVDPRCTRIYSIDPRLNCQPDDRKPGLEISYDNNSIRRMMDLLRGLDHGDPGKVECLAEDARNIPPARIAHAPQLAFIDGVHTQAAVFSDFQFCAKVLSKDGAVLFHDCSIVLPAILEILGDLRREGRTCLPLKFEDEVFGIFFDPELVRSDPWLASLLENQRFFLPRTRAKLWLKQRLPVRSFDLIRRLRRRWA